MSGECDWDKVKFEHLPQPLQIHYDMREAGVKDGIRVIKKVFGNGNQYPSYFVKILFDGEQWAEHWVLVADEWTYVIMYF